MASGSNKVIVAALFGNMAVAVTKFIAAGMTGSSAMFSEGIHSVVDTGNQALLLFGLRQARKPADDDFPFGHGKEIYFWSFVVAILLFSLGSGISIYEGVKSILEPRPVDNPMVNYIVLSLAIVFEGVAWAVAFREFRRAMGNRGYFEAVRTGKDPTLFVVLFEDSAAMAGLVAALIGIYAAQVTGIWELDGVASVLIGLILGGTAVWLAYETKGLLIGESANRQVVEGIRTMVRSLSEVERVNEVLTMHMGPDFILANISVEFRDELDVGAVEKVVAGLDRQIKREFPRVKRVFVEAESHVTRVIDLPPSPAG